MSFPGPSKSGVGPCAIGGQRLWPGSKAGIEVRDALNERLSQEKVIDLREVERGKYFRLVAEVNADGEKLSANSVWG